MGIPYRFDPLGTLGSLKPFVCPVMVSATEWRMEPEPSCGVVSITSSRIHAYAPQAYAWHALIGLTHRDGEAVAWGDVTKLFISSMSFSHFWQVVFSKPVLLEQVDFSMYTSDTKNTSANWELLLDGQRASAGTQFIERGGIFKKNTALMSRWATQLRLNVTYDKNDYWGMNIDGIFGKI